MLKKLSLFFLIYILSQLVFLLPEKFVLLAFIAGTIIVPIILIGLGELKDPFMDSAMFSILIPLGAINYRYAFENTGVKDIKFFLLLPLVVFMIGGLFGMFVSCINKKSQISPPEINKKDPD